MLAVILAIQFEQVERIQEHLTIVPAGMQLVEVRLAVLPRPNRFPIHDDGPDPEGQEGIRLSRDTCRTSRSPGGGRAGPGCRHVGHSAGSRRA